MTQQPTTATCSVCKEKVTRDAPHMECADKFLKTEEGGMFTYKLYGPDSLSPLHTIDYGHRKGPLPPYVPKRFKRRP